MERERERERADSEFSVSGPHRDKQELARRTPVLVTPSEIKQWNNQYIIPSLKTIQQKTIYSKQQNCPSFSSTQHNWQAFRPAELHPTFDKEQMEEEFAKGYWPVYKGASFNIWQPDTGEYYRWADPSHISDFLYSRRLVQSKRPNSQFFVSHKSGINKRTGCSEDWIIDKQSLCLFSPRITIRDVTYPTNQRTTICSLIPSNRVLTGKAPYLFFRVGDERDSSFVLGVMSSIPFDWNTRCIVELSLSLSLLMDFPIPCPDREDPLRRRVEVIAGRMATKEKGHPGFKEWAEAVGVEEGSVTPKEEPELLAELDTVVAILYGLELEDLKFIYDTFHPTSDYSDRYRLATKYWEQHTS